MRKRRISTREVEHGPRFCGACLDNHAPGKPCGSGARPDVRPAIPRDSCLSCGLKVPPSARGCARCSVQNFKVPPAWCTEQAIREQRALNPGAEWPIVADDKNDQVEQLLRAHPQAIGRRVHH